MFQISNNLHLLKWIKVEIICWIKLDFRQTNSCTFPFTVDLSWHQQNQCISLYLHFFLFKHFEHHWFRFNGSSLAGKKIIVCPQFMTQTLVTTTRRNSIYLQWLSMAVFRRNTKDRILFIISSSSINSVQCTLKSIHNHLRSVKKASIR